MLSDLCLLLGWQLLVALGLLTPPALPAASNRILISLAMWTSAFQWSQGIAPSSSPVSSGQRRRTPMGYGWPPLSSLSQAPASQLMNRLWRPSPRYSRRYSPSGLSGFFHRQAGNPEVVRCLQTLPAVRPPCLCLALRRPSLEFRTCAPSVLVASRHAFAVGFLATLIFSIRPRILPSFLNSRELWSARLSLVDADHGGLHFTSARGPTAGFARPPGR